MNKLQAFTKSYVHKISDNVYMLKPISSKDYDNFFRTMIDYKNEIASQNENLNIKDMALARTIGIYGLRGRPCKKSYVSVKSSKKVSVCFSWSSILKFLVCLLSIVKSFLHLIVYYNMFLIILL